MARRISALPTQPAGITGVAFVSFFIVIAVFAPLLAPHSPTDQNLFALANGCCPGPSRDHSIGLDELGRDEFSRVMYGARYSLVIGVVVRSRGAVDRMVLGSIAGCFGGWADSVVMRGMDIMLAIPGLLLAIGIVAMLGAGSARS